MLITKPKILVDIKTSRISTYGTVSTHVNLSPRQARFRVSGMVKGFLFLLVLTYALFGTVVAPSLNSLAAAPSAEERQQLEQELSVLESQIEDYEATVAAYRKQGNSLKNEISSLTAKKIGRAHV